MGVNSLPAISAEGVGRRYGPRWILSPINLEVRCGEAIALFGNNGSGKTTLLRIFATLLAPSTGSVRILGLDLQREKEAIRRHLRFLPHEKQLYPFLTVRENLRLASAVRGIEARDDELALSRLSLKRVADRPIHELSEGMKKRVVLARLLLGDFDVILLDEPHPTLDQEGREVLGELLREWKKSGKTVILASHDHAQALAHADRLVILHEGGVRYDGPPGDAPL